MRGTYVTALVITGAVAIWLLSGLLTAEEGVSEHPSLAQSNALAGNADDRPPTAVRAKVIHARMRPEQISVRGRTENKRTVAVRAETQGRVVARPVERGEKVESGDLLCRIAVEDRQARITQGKEGVNQARLEYLGSLKLKDRGFQSATAIAQARARLATAQAQLEAAALDLERTYIRAPFDGIVEDVELEVGDYAQSGTACARIVDLDPMLLVGQIAERDAHRVSVGSPATGRLATGAEVSGPISFVGQQAEPETRTYRIEITVPNPDYALRSGVTTEIDIRVGELLAHKITPALFALDDEGRLGVRIVDADRRVRFRHVDVVADEHDGAWVTGLPSETMLITVGQEYVVAGDRVAVEMQAPGADDSPDELPILARGARGEGAAPGPS